MFLPQKENDVRHLFLWVWVTSFSIIFSGCIHLLTNFMIQFSLFYRWIESHCVCVSYFPYSLLSRRTFKLFLFPPNYVWQWTWLDKCLWSRMLSPLAINSFLIRSCKEEQKTASAEIVSRDIIVTYKCHICIQTVFIGTTVRSHT